MESLALGLGVVGLGTVLSLACSSPGAASMPHPPGTISDESGITDASDTVLTLGPNGDPSATPGCAGGWGVGAMPEALLLALRLRLAKLARPAE